MRRRVSLRRREFGRFGLGFAGCVSFAALALSNSDFVLDDAFITFRYAQNLMAGHGLAWNIGEPPIEGYTSFLWVLLNAVAMAGGIDPVAFSKWFSAACGLCIVWYLASASRHAFLPMASIWISGVALSPVVALLYQQGMETAMVSLILLALAAIAVRAAEDPSWKIMAALPAVAVLALLARPDSAFFVAGTLGGLFVSLLLRRHHQAVAALLGWSVVCALPAAGYMAWRIQYFGYWFPNTYYLKLGTGGGWLKAGGIEYATTFLIEWLLPYILLIAGLWIWSLHGKNRIHVEGTWSLTWPIVLGCVLHWAYLTTLVPIQGYFWRYAMPVVPAFLLVANRWFETFRPGSRFRDSLAWMGVFLVFVAWHLRFLPVAQAEREFRSQADRVRAGQALAGTSGTMLTSAAGALPFYSGWRAEDLLGLVSEEIAHHGVSAEFLREFDPDLIVIRSPVPDRLVFEQTSHILIEEYMLREGFVAVAALHRSLGFHLYYFVRRDAPVFEEAADRLTRIEGVEYGELSALMQNSKIPIYERDRNRSRPSNDPAPSSAPDSASGISR